jgi:hypothetical protein
MNELRLPKPVPLGPRTYAIVSAAVLGAATGAPLVNSMMQIGVRVFGAYDRSSACSG